MNEQLKNSLHAFLLAGSAALGGCTENIVPGLDGGNPSGHDSQEFCLDPVTYEGTWQDLSQNDVHCGECNNTCDVVADCRDSDCTFPAYYGLDNFCADDSWCPPEEICIKLPREMTGYCGLEELVCEFDEECGTEKLCISGYCTRSISEVCNGLDDDADGLVDDGLFRDSCYTGPEGTEGIGVCRPGRVACIEGRWSGCSGEVTPSLENGIFECDGLDNDCNGCADNNYIDGVCVPIEERLFDIVVIMDVSDSMSEEIAAAQEAMRRIGRPFAGNDNYHFALIQIPYGGTYSGRAEDGVIHHFSDYAPFRAALESITLGGASEQSYDVIYLAARDSITTLRYRGGAQRIFIMFTDETGQSFEIPRITEELMCSALYSDDVFGSALLPEFFEDFDLCADPIVDLSQDPAVVAEQFKDIFAAACVHR